MNTRTHRDTESPAATDRVGGPRYRTVRFPSVDATVPPTIELTLPESWRPIGSVVVNEMRPRPDLAVAGPDVSEGVRPNILVKVSRIPGEWGGPEPERDAAILLVELFRRQGVDDGIIGFQSRIHDDGDPQPYGVSRYYEHVGEIDVLRLTCAVVASSGPVAHLVVVQGAMSARAGADRAAVEAAFGSLRISGQAPPPPVGAG